jgi:hypothetical protein
VPAAAALRAAGKGAEVVVVAGHGFDIARAPVRLSDQGLQAGDRIPACLEEHFT